MNPIEEKINSLIGHQIEYQNQILTVKSGKETTTLVVINTNKFPINFHKHSLEFKNLKPIQTEKIESKMNSENIPSMQEQSRVVSQHQSQNQVSIANALQGSAELRETLIATLNRLTSAKTEGEKKSAIEIAKAVSLVGKEVNELLKTGVRAVEVIKKI